jgi:hypothetical protein
MYGVVLWCDAQENKAVIWCEDHGDLAFYRQPENAIEVSLDAGDWVQFDMTTDRHLRFAHNPRLVSEGVSPGLADVLADASPASDHSGQPAHSRASAEIIQFARPQASHLAKTTLQAAASHA